MDKIIFTKEFDWLIKSIQAMEHLKIAQEFWLNPCAHKINLSKPIVLYSSFSGSGKFTLMQQVAKHFNLHNHNKVEIFLIDDNANKIMDVRNILEKLKYASFNKKFLLIKNYEKLNINVQNLLLKTLEEPLSDVYILITSNNVHHLPNTLVSRCVMLKLSKIKTEDLDFLLHNKRFLNNKIVSKDVRDNKLLFYQRVSNNLRLLQKVAVNSSLWKDFVHCWQQNLNNSQLPFVYMEKILNVKDDLLEIWISFMQYALFQNLLYKSDLSQDFFIKDEEILLEPQKNDKIFQIQHFIFLQELFNKIQYFLTYNKLDKKALTMFIYSYMQGIRNNDAATLYYHTDLLR